MLAHLVSGGPCWALQQQWLTEKPSMDLRNEMRVPFPCPSQYPQATPSLQSQGRNSRKQSCKLAQAVRKLPFPKLGGGPRPAQFQPSQHEFPAQFPSNFQPSSSPAQAHFQVQPISSPAQAHFQAERNEKAETPEILLRRRDQFPFARAGPLELSRPVAEKLSRKAQQLDDQAAKRRLYGRREQEEEEEEDDDADATDDSGNSSSEHEHSHSDAE